MRTVNVIVSSRRESDPYLKLAREPALLASLKVKLEQNRKSCALFDTKRATRNFEAAYTMDVGTLSQWRDETRSGRAGEADRDRLNNQWRQRLVAIRRSSRETAGRLCLD